MDRKSISPFKLLCSPLSCRPYNPHVTPSMRTDGTMHTHLYITRKVYDIQENVKVTATSDHVVRLNTSRCADGPIGYK